jgi:two-component system NarL family sensor kinase
VQTARDDQVVGRARNLALLRIAALLLIVGGELIVPPAGSLSGAFGWTVAAAGAYALATLVWGLRRMQGIPRVAFLAADVACVCALTLSSGGAESEVTGAFFLTAVGAVFLQRPSLAAAVASGSVAAYVAVALVGGATAADAGTVAVTAMYIGAVGGIAVAFSAELAKRGERIAGLGRDRAELTRRTLEGRDVERRHISQHLHDQAIPVIAATRSELQRVQRGQSSDSELNELDAALGELAASLRDTIFELYPAALDRAGLAPALEEIAAAYQQKSGVRFDVRVGPDCRGHVDRPLFAIARELIGNTAKHSGAREAVVSVMRERGLTVLEVEDDGRGFGAPAEAARPRDGHIGLASCVQRVEEVGGTLTIESAPGQGARVRVAFPDTGLATDDELRLSAAGVVPG